MISELTIILRFIKFFTLLRNNKLKFKKINKQKFVSYTSLCIQWILESWDNSSKDDSEIERKKERKKKKSSIRMTYLLYFKNKNGKKKNLPKFPWAAWYNDDFELLLLLLLLLLLRCIELCELFWNEYVNCRLICRL